MLIRGWAISVTGMHQHWVGRSPWRTVEFHHIRMWIMHGNGSIHRLMFMFHIHSYNLNDMPPVIYVVEMSAALWCSANIQQYSKLSTNKPRWFSLENIGVSWITIRLHCLIGAVWINNTAFLSSIYTREH